MCLKNTERVMRAGSFPDGDNVLLSLKESTMNVCNATRDYVYPTVYTGPFQAWRA